MVSFSHWVSGAAAHVSVLCLKQSSGPLGSCGRKDLEVHCLFQYSLESGVTHGTQQGKIKHENAKHQSNRRAEKRGTYALWREISNTHRSKEYSVMDPHVPIAQPQALPTQGQSYFIYTPNPPAPLAFWGKYRHCSVLSVITSGNTSKTKELFRKNITTIPLSYLNRWIKLLQYHQISSNLNFLGIYIFYIHIYICIYFTYVYIYVFGSESMSK